MDLCVISGSDAFRKSIASESIRFRHRPDVQNHKHDFKPNSLLQSGNLEVGRRVTLKGGACMLLPGVYADSFVFQSGGAFYPLASYENRRPFYACYRKGEAVKPYTRALIMITAAVLSPNAEHRETAR